jgi:hypothetical protein
MAVALASVTGSVSFTSSKGSLTFFMRGAPTSIGTVTRFGGVMTVTGGSGRYDDARGSARFTGKVNRRTWAATVNAEGTISY